MQIIAQNADPSGIGHPLINPKWTAIVLGETVVDKVGLYDERFYPLYYDDNDYERRCDAAGVKSYTIPAVIHHTNSASINHERNNNSFARNGRLYADKTANNDNSWTWTLATRRANRWD
jgi:GT2 family glycosyltransferase